MYPQAGGLVKAEVGNRKAEIQKRTWVVCFEVREFF
jgi:hypothetical protein